jgi:MFS family permease
LYYEVSNKHIPYLVGLINYLLGFAIQSSIILIPVLVKEFGATEFQVGLVGAVYGAAFLVSSLISGWKSDVMGRLRFMRLGLFVSTIAFAGQLLAHNVFLLALSRGAVGLALGISTAATIAYAFEMGMDMGKFSSYASLGWIFSAFTAAMTQSIPMLFLFSAIACLLCFLLTLFFRETLPQQADKPPNLWRVLRRGARVYLAVAVRHIGATSVWVILPLHMLALGMDLFWISITWMANFTVQFIVMRFLERFPERKLFAIGQVLSVIVFASLAFAVSKGAIMAIQMLLGVAWSLLYVGALMIILKSGEERGTAGGIFQSTLNLCAAIGPLLGGLIAQSMGYHSVMLFAAGLGLVGMLIAVPKK